MTFTLTRASNRLKKDLYTLYQNRCFLCGLKSTETGKVLEIHRIVPNREGGKYTRDNCIPLCKPCHLRCEGLSKEEILLLDPAFSNFPRPLL